MNTMEKELLIKDPPNALLYVSWSEEEECLIIIDSDRDATGLNKEEALALFRFLAKEVFPEVCGAWEVANEQVG